VVAIDLPSGLDCDTGTAAGECVRADTTVTFVARKRGFDTPEAGRFTGTVHVVGIGAPKKLLAEFE
jgi:NAD(P)H-hydrate epimerase